MRVFHCTTFTGRWPVGTAAVVVAEDASAAARLLWDALKERGLPQQIELADIKELDLTTAAAIVLRDGNY